jgi:ADP-ribose pyrophosphatase YjhB (NUDIX family)
MQQEEPSDREYPRRPIVGVGAVVLVAPDVAPRLGWTEIVAREGIVLVKRRFEPLAGQWSLPGGTLEVGETLEAGVTREIGEETGLTVDVGPIVDVFDRIFRDADGRVRYHYVLVDYVCRARGGRLAAGSDVAEVAIADPARLDAYALMPKTIEVIDRVLAPGKGRIDAAVP